MLKTRQKVNYIFRMLFVSVLASVSTLLLTNSTYATHTATITTSGNVNLNVASSGSSDSAAMGTDTVTTITTCTSGYTLGISSSGSDRSLYLNGNSSNTGTGYTVISPVSGTTTLSTNNWGYSTTTTSITGNFIGLTNTSATIKSSNTATPALGDTTSVYFGVKVDNTATPGAYTMPTVGNVPGAIIYTLTIDPSCTVADITYDGNSADAGTMGAVHTAKKAGDSVDLIASNYSRAGYGFAGWSFDNNAGTKLVDNDTTNNPVVYGPQETITLPEDFLDYDTDNDGEVKLYAVWIPAEKDPNDSTKPLYLQGWVGCANLDTATYDSVTGELDLTKRSVTALTDMRDNETYAIAKLADGQCWMIENLRLEADATRGNNINDPSFTNEFLAQGYGKSSTYGNFVGLASAEGISAFSNNTTANSLYSTDGSTLNTISGYYQGHRFPRYNNVNTNNRANNPTSNNDNIFSYGNYYTWHAAIADVTHYETEGLSITTTSLCPIGWHLPTGGRQNVGDFLGLGIAVMGFNPLNDSESAYQSETNTSGKTATETFRSYPNNLIYSGGINNGTMQLRGAYGLYWSSTAMSNSTLARYAYMRNNIFYPGTNNTGKRDGRSIRCLASSSTNYTLSYNANGGEFSSNTPASQSITANGYAEYTLSNIVPTRSGYTFMGWIDEDGNIGQPSGVFRTKKTNTSLYAIWSNNSCNSSATTIGTGNTSTDAVCLQDVKPSMKASLPTADSSSGTYTLIDARDNQSYTVAKLVDGELWLTKNLNYGSSSDTLLTSHDTDLPSGLVFKAPASTTSFETTDTEATRISPKLLTDNTYGGYYSYAAAIASNKAYSSYNENIITSICPKGWDLPTSTQYSNLKSQGSLTSYATTLAAPYSFIYAGYRNGTSFSGQTTSIRMWTSTNNSSSQAYYTTVYQAPSYSSNYKRYGESIRCLASNGTATIHYDANGGTGTMADQAAEINSSNVQANGFTAPANKSFKEWNTSANGTGTSIAPGTLVSTLAQNGDTVNLYAIWHYVYTVTYNINGGDAGTMGNQTNVTEGTTLLASNYSRAGYGFAGWSTDPNAASNSSAKIYGPQEAFSMPTYPGSNSITLYAVWVPSAGYFQNSATVSSVCNSLTQAPANGSANITSVSALTDQRDNETYAIAKLADGKCWMIENLRLESTNSDNSTGALAQGYNSSFAGLATAESANFSNSTTANSLYSTDGSTTKTIDSTGGNLGYRFPRYNNYNHQTLSENRPQNPTTNSATNSTTNAGMYSYGNYYTWHAAIADTAHNGSNNTSSDTTSLCPTGWRLPRGGQNTVTAGQNGDFYVLTTTITGTTPNHANGGYAYYQGTVDGTDVGSLASKSLRNYPNNFLHSGYFSTSSASNRGSYGNYWSSTAYGSYNSYYLNLDSSSGVHPGTDGSYKSYGRSIRCLASQSLSINSLTYLQDFSTLSSADKTTVLDSMEEDEQYQLQDARDGKTYYISKLQDGNVWMTQNLDLDLGINTLTHSSTTLQHDDTDLGWGTDSATTTWNPTNATVNLNNDGQSFSSLTSSNTAPISLNVGNWHYAGYNGSNLLPYTEMNYLTSSNRITSGGVTTVYDSNSNAFFATSPFSGTGTSNNGAHGHLGNYYNWSAAIASNDSSGFSSNTINNTSANPQNSICPAGWRLPIIASYTSGTLGNNEPGNLNYYYNNSSSVTSTGLEDSPLYFSRGGSAFNTSVYGGLAGHYWSSSLVRNNTAYSFSFGNLELDTVDPIYRSSRGNLLSVRCLLR